MDNLNFALVIRLHYQDGTYEDLTDEPLGWIHDGRTARAVAGMLSLGRISGLSEIVALPVTGNFITDLSDQERQAADGQEVKSER